MAHSRASAVMPEQFATFGELLKYLRRRAGLTQRELSIAVGYSESQISRLEQNQRLPDAAFLQARLIPALHLETELDWAARVLELGGASRAAAVDPPPAPAAPPPNNLPWQLTSFIGREKMLADVQQLLLGGASVPAARLVTLTGHGGWGKPVWHCRPLRRCCLISPPGSGWPSWPRSPILNSCPAPWLRRLACRASRANRIWPA